ncbi:MAG: hypothetical protein ACYC9D_10670 [Candidatus Dormibacteria bacterium]
MGRSSSGPLALRGDGILERILDRALLDQAGSSASATTAVESIERTA